MNLKPGTLIVLEGMDATGKSTQVDELNKLFPDGKFTHQPSGVTVVGEVVYQITEQVSDMHPLTRQFLHLASHAEHYAKWILPTLSTDGVFMDRCWWSTVAYGYFAGRLHYLMSLDDFIRMVQLPTQELEPTLVFVFMNPWHHDVHNTPELADGYRQLIDRFGENTIVVPKLGIEETTAFIVDVLRSKHLLEA